MIKLLVFDIDGVITDGTVLVDSAGREQKKFNLKDVDSIFHLKKEGYILAAITGENTEIVDYFKNKFPWDYFYQGNQDKQKTLIELENKTGITQQEICYIGDGKYDVEPLQYAGLAVCPADAIDMAKSAADIILQHKAGEGCLWELVSILKDYNKETPTEQFCYQRLEEHTDLFRKMAADRKLIQNVMNLAHVIFCSLKSGKQLFLCGNGGSAADAQHIATEFVSRFYKERLAMNAEALTVNTSTLTAISNDYSFERIFARQIEAKAKQGDVLIGISTSGKSKNVIEALRYAKEHGIHTAMLMGGIPNNELETICDFIICVPADVTPRIQEAHIFIGHIMAEYIENEMFSE